MGDVTQVNRFSLAGRDAGGAEQEVAETVDVAKGGVVALSDMH